MVTVRVRVRLLPDTSERVESKKEMHRHVSQTAVAQQPPSQSKPEQDGKIIL